jgi:outer membrane protein assembly factor BamB
VPRSTCRNDLHPYTAGGRPECSLPAHLYAVDRKTYDLLWTVEVPGKPTSPVASDGRLIVGTDLGWLVSFGPTSAADPG